MRISAVDTQNTSFNGIYVHTMSSKFSKAQKVVAEKLKQTLRTPYQQFDCKTAENYYKNNYNTDFLLAAGEGDSVILSGTKDMRNKQGQEVFSETFRIGEYDKNFEKQSMLDEVQKSVLKDRDRSKTGMLIGEFCVAGLMILASIFQNPIHSKGEKLKEKSVIENADTLKISKDTLKQGADTIFTDTAKVLKKIK